MDTLRAALDALPMPTFQHDMGADRFKVAKGSFWWHIRIGDGTANVGKFHSELAAQDVALKLLTAFRDGGYTAHQDADEAIRAARRDGARLALELAVAVCEAVWRQQYSTAETPEGGVAIQSCQFALRAQLKELDQ